MQKYASNVQDKSGNAVSGASVLVTDSVGAPASLYAGPTPTSGAQANPIITDADGEYAFYAPNGRYSISVTARGFIGDAATDLLLYDPSEPYTPIDATISDSAASAFASKQAAAASAAAAAASSDQTALDKIATNSDRTQTGLDRTATANSATAAAGSASDALTSKNAAAVSAASVNDANLVHKTGDETIAGNKTFSGTTDGITKTMVGLGNVDNTQDASKPVSAPQAAAIVAGAWATYGGTANAITLTAAVPPTAYAAGQLFRFRATAINTGAGTINVSGLGAKTAVTVTGAALPAGYIRTDVDTICVYDGTKFVVSREAEYGINANGEYWRSASGKQTCHTAFESTTVAANLVTQLTWDFPALFADSPAVSYSSGSPSASEDVYGLVRIYVVNTTYVQIGYRNGAVAQIIYGIATTANGRWY